MHGSPQSMLGAGPHWRPKTLPAVARRQMKAARAVAPLTGAAQRHRLIPSLRAALAAPVAEGMR